VELDRIEEPPFFDSGFVSTNPETRKPRVGHPKIKTTAETKKEKRNTKKAARYGQKRLREAKFGRVRWKLS
jgi:hypothetical protein